MTISLVLALLAIGLFVGIVSNIFGLGGGVLITPLLPLVVSISQHDLIATSLACIFTVVSFNVWAFSREKKIDWSVARIYGVLAAVGALSASTIATFLSEQFLRGSTFSMMMLLGLSLIRHPKTEKISAHQKLFYMPSGFFAGMATGLTGIGTGAILSPIFLAKKILPHDKVSPTTNAVLIFATFTSVIAYAIAAVQQGRSVFDAIQIQYVVFICAGALFISRKARKWQGLMPEVMRRRYMACVLALLSLIVLRAFLKGYGI
ncbi:MAG: sulfite exporter TauE/SafE family protein [Bdellovibrionota bacterium]